MSNTYFIQSQPRSMIGPQVGIPTGPGTALSSSRLTGQTRAESVTPAAVPPTIPISVINAIKLPSVLGKSIPAGKLGTPVRVDEGRGDGSGNDNQSPANPGESTTPANGSGKVMQDANIHLMFWGAAWLLATNQPTAAEVVAALTSLVSGPYLGKLAQYGVKHAQIADANVVDFGGQSAAPAGFTDTDATNLIEDLINEGLMPALTNATAYQELFALILPSGPAGAGGGWTSPDTTTSKPTRRGRISTSLS